MSWMKGRMGHWYQTHVAWEEFHRLRLQGGKRRSTNVGNVLSKSKTECLKKWEKSASASCIYKVEEGLKLTKPHWDERKGSWRQGRVAWEERIVRL